jgi:ribosomal protein S18 acetylase RimI-like enzyme
VSTIRRMREQDADTVRQVDAAAFGAWLKQVQGGTAPTYRRTRTNVLACRGKDPAGCFVAEEGDQVVGFIFSRTWGSVGWFGTFAVLPRYQGIGIGKRLIAASLEYLRQDPSRVIGLETMSDSPYNLGLYLRLGFQARLPTFLLSRHLDPLGDGEIMCSPWSTASAGTRERWLVDLREATGRLQNGLDYSKEIMSTVQHGLGEVLVLDDGEQAVGLSVVWLDSVCEGWGAERASVQVLALHPARTDDGALFALLRGSESLARARGKPVLAVPVNACHAWALERLLQWGYRVERAMVRMVLGSTNRGPSIDGCVDFSRWAG